MIKTKNKVIGSGLLFILLLALFFTFWTIQYHNVAIHAQIHVGKENHLPSTAISIVGVRLLGSERYLNFLESKIGVLIIIFQVDIIHQMKLILLQ